MLLAPIAQQNPKPFTQSQIEAMVRDGLADETGAKAIEQRRIDFAKGKALLAENLKKLRARIS